MADDAHLLRQFVEAHSETAFGELVQRHLPLVYHAAVRRLGTDRHLAEDVTQAVFVLLARKSAALRDHPSLAGWLHTTTHFTCAREARNLRRRQQRERALAAMNDLEHASSPDWERIRPVLDEVLLELNARDREAVLLRFFENCSIAEVAARLRSTEGAAYKCVERALDKLRARLAHRGVQSTAALAALLTTHGALATPAGLGASITSAAIGASIPISAAAGVTLMTTKTTSLVVAAGLLVGIGVATYEWQAQRATSEALHSVERDVRALQARLTLEQDRLARERAAQQAAAASPAAVVRSATPAAKAAPRPISPEDLARKGRDFLKAHPEVEAVLAANFDASLRHTYADLIAALGLTAAETERFIGVMMKVQMRTVDDKVLRLTDELPPPGEYARQLKEVLGEERYRLYRDWAASAPSRSLTGELVRSLYATPAAPAPGQLAQFKHVVQQVIDDPKLSTRNLSGWSSIPPPMWDEIMKRTSEILSPPQREALVDLQQLALFLQAQSQAFRALKAKP